MLHVVAGTSKEMNVHVPVASIRLFDVLCNHVLFLFVQQLHFSSSLSCCCCCCCGKCCCSVVWCFM